MNVQLAMNPEVENQKDKRKLDNEVRGRGLLPLDNTAVMV